MFFPQLPQRSRMALLFIIAVLSIAGTMVDSESNITSCDAPLSNTTCTQGSCLQPPCTMGCGLTTSYETCEQTCNSSCDYMKCDASGRCLQTCSSANCTSMACDAKHCFQKCEGSICGVLTCAKNAESPNSCEQSSTTAQMICERDTCDQNCNKGQCSLTCLSGVKVCTQSCNNGNCQFKCEAEKCTLNCNGGNCTEIKPSTTKMSPTTTTTPTPTPTGIGDRLQMRASVGLALMFAVVAFM